jgi:hypothetical protein
MNSVLDTPSWAYDFCYYFVFVSAIVVVTTVYSLFKLFMLPTLAKKFLPMTSLTLTLVLSALVTVVLTMMQFWICRGALGPREKFRNRSREGFAVRCSATGDCTDVMGLPQNSDCSCGARGLCGGCKMRNGGNDLPGN